MTATHAGRCKLSVMLKAYNHEPFIAQAIEGALAQETQFEFEILIGEDCSTDRTRGIVLSYARRYPDRIRLVGHDRNVGMVRNTMALYRAARGEYVAWLDGDDYWCSPQKLQRQVEFLDAHRHYVGCCHAAVMIRWNGYRAAPALAGRPRTFTLENMLLGAPGCTSTYVYRKLLEAFPAWFEELPYADMALKVLHAEHGPTLFMPEAWAVYRTEASSAPMHSAERSSNHASSRISRRDVQTAYAAVNRHFGFRYDALIRKRVATLDGGHAEGRGAGLRLRASRRRSMVWRAVRQHPRLANVVLESAGALAPVVVAARAVRSSVNRWWTQLARRA